MSLIWFLLLGHFLCFYHINTYTGNCRKIFSRSTNKLDFPCIPFSLFVNDEILFSKLNEPCYPEYSGPKYSTDFLEGITLFPYLLILMNNQDLKHF